MKGYRSLQLGANQQEHPVSFASVVSGCSPEPGKPPGGLVLVNHPWPCFLQESWAVLAAVSQESSFSVSADVFTVCPAAVLQAEPITLHQTLVFPAHCHPRGQTRQEGEGHPTGVLPSCCCRGTAGISPIPVTTSLVLQSPLQAGLYTLHPDFSTAVTCATCRNAAFVFNREGVTQGREGFIQRPLEHTDCIRFLKMLAHYKSIPPPSACFNSVEREGPSSTSRLQALFKYHQDLLKDLFFNV